MKRETLRKNRIHAAEKKEHYAEREKYWARLEQEAEDAESMKIIRKKHITPEQLAMLNQLSEKEVAEMLARRNKETMETALSDKNGSAVLNEKEKETGNNAEKNFG